MRLTLISDTHSDQKHLNKKLAVGGDLIIHSGDVSRKGAEYEIREFCKWFDDLNYTHKIFIAGNHDFLFQTNPALALDIVNQHDSITYLQDSNIVINDLNIFGSPWSPIYKVKAFNLNRGNDLLEKWQNIPDNTDILITHGPPFGVGDYSTLNDKNAGCSDLYSEVIDRIKPKIHVFGHIHSGYSCNQINDILFINASSMDNCFEISHPPIHLEFDKNLNTLKIN